MRIRPVPPAKSRKAMVGIKPDISYVKKTYLAGAMVRIRLKQKGNGRSRAVAPTNAPLRIPCQQPKAE